MQKLSLEQFLQENLSPEEIKELSPAGLEIMQGMLDTINFERGDKTAARKTDKINPRAVRKQLDLTRSDFADLIGVSIATVDSWESGARNPNLSAKILMNIAMEDIDMVRRNA